MYILQFDDITMEKRIEDIIFFIFVFLRQSARVYVHCEKIRCLSHCVDIWANII